MIACILHKGSGLGNQLHRIVASRVLALEKSYEFGVVAPELFKGKDFMNLDMGLKSKTDGYFIENSSGKVIPFTEGPDGPRIRCPVWEEWNKNVYDPDFNFVENDTIIDGNFEDPKYFEHRLSEISEWLKVEPMEVVEDVCSIGFRGGEYYTVPELGLPKEYYERAMQEMRKINPKMRFVVHTDDEDMARQFFPEFRIIRDIEINWRAMRYGKYAIIANSSFYVLPRLLSDGLTIAPRYWNRYNTKQWDYPQNYYKQFKYI